MKKPIQTSICRFRFPPVLKRMLTAFILLMCILNAGAQTSERKWNLGMFGGISTYSGHLGNGISDFKYTDFQQNLLGGITISRYLNPSFDVTFMAVDGTWGYYNTTPPESSFKGNMLHGNFNLKYKLNNGYLIPEGSLLAPYVLAGIGMSSFTGDRINNNLDYPFIVGAGVRIRITEVLSLTAQSTFGYMSTAHNNPADNQTPLGNDKFMLHMVGVGLNLGKARDEDKDGVSDKKDKCAGTPKGVKVDENGCPYDKDGDGVLDYQDKCPDIAGTAAAQGCPDADGDGIVDSKDKCPNVKGTLELDGCPDRDGDGIRDEDDQCPDVKGLAQFKGCPDTDGDGIEDAKDMCPTVKGLAATNGCPDTDNDGVHDGIDKCPTVAGNAGHSGCPDSDNDGVFDDIDQCVSIPGTAANKGCPELNKETKQLFQKALQGIQFQTGKAVIKPVSFPILNAIAKVMHDNPSYKLLIGGHTDNVGEDAMNMTLSQDRATAVADYLITKGTDPLRVSAKGFGETQPVDTNNSPQGRARNRRVELSVEFIETTTTK